MLGTWRTNDAEKNHTHKIGKRKKKKGKRKGKRDPMMDGWTWKMAWLFVWEGIGIGIGRGRGSTRRKEGITIRYEGSASASESSCWHE